MYYLQDQHSQYEYALYTRVGIGTPYIMLLPYTDFSEIHIKVNDIERKHQRQGTVFFIDNDFYHNIYSNAIGGTYYKFLRRKVNDWECFETKEKESRLKLVKAN